MDNSALVLFRIFFGWLMFFECVGALLLKWVTETFVTAPFSFPFIGFEFLQQFNGPQMYVVYVLLSILGLMIGFGYQYRFAIISFTLLWAVTYFNQKSHYNNHYYLILLVCLLMWIVPANTYASLDVKQGRVEQSLTCPKWATRIFMLQVAIVYFYAALAKLYPDWLAAKPVEIWLTAKNYTSPFWSASFAETLRTFFSQRWVHYFFSYTGIVFDFLVIPFFLWNKWTRWLALIASFIFHLTNSAIFQIGVFPYFALAFVIFYFEPDEIRRRFFKNKPQADLSMSESPSIQTTFWRPLLIPILGIYFLIQILLPVRHYFIRGNVLWDESGHRLSWRMMLRSKWGMTRFIVELPDGQREFVPLNEYLAEHQFGDVRVKPDMMWQFAQKLKQIYADKGIPDIKVFIESQISVNGRPYEEFIDRDFDISAEPWHRFDRQPWVLDEPEGFKDYYKNYSKPKPTD